MVSSKTTIEDINVQYKDLVRAMHPDRGGSHEAFVEMENEFQAALRYISRRGERAAQREQAAALLAMVVEEVVRDPMVISTLIRRIQDGKATEWFKAKGIELIGDFFKAMKAE